MKSLFSFVFLFLFSNSVFAANLCDTSCNLTITFPNRGSIVAVEALTFTFGTDGVLDLGSAGTINSAVPPANTDFSTGGTLVLAAGESISINGSGSLYLGTGGAIDHTNFAITTDGEFVLDIDSVADSIYIGDLAINGNFNGTGSLTINVTGTDLELGSISTKGNISASANSINIVGSIGGSGTDSVISLIANELITQSDGLISADSIDLTGISLGTAAAPITVSTSNLSLSADDVHLSGSSSFLFPCTVSISSDTSLITHFDSFSIIDFHSCQYINRGSLIGDFNLTLPVLYSDVSITSNATLPTNFGFVTTSEPIIISELVPNDSTIHDFLFTSNGVILVYTDPFGVERIVKVWGDEEAIAPFVTKVLDEPLVDWNVVEFMGESCVVQGDECVTDDGKAYEVTSSGVEYPIDITLPEWQGWAFLTIDDVECVVTDGKCFDANGIAYTMTEEGLVRVQGSGSINIGVLLFVLFRLMYVRRFKLNMCQHPIMLNRTKQQMTLFQ